MLPNISRLLQDDTHRLIPSAYGEDTALHRLTTDSEDLTALFELEGATNERLLGEAGLLPGITARELAFRLSYSHIVNAAFTHDKPFGSRNVAGQSWPAPQPHRYDDFPVGYSSACRAAAEPASASPAEAHLAGIGPGSNLSER